MARSRELQVGMVVALLLGAPSPFGPLAAGPKPPAPPPAAGKPEPAKQGATAAEPRPAAPQPASGEAPGPAAADAAPADPQVLALEEKVRKLEAQLESVETRSKEDHDRLQLLEQEMPQVAASAAMNERLQKLEAATRELPEATAVATAGNFPGSLRIPGTDAALKVGGQVRVTLVDSFAAIGSGDRFIVSSIPVEGTATAAEGPRLTAIANPSRFNIDVRSPSTAGDLRSFIEADFAGANGTLRLRHAFLQWGKLLVGQTWSTFADPEAEPDGIDFEGLNAISLFRTVQARFTQPITDTLTLAAAVENPKPAVSGATGVTQVPDLVVRIRWDAGRAPGSLGIIRKLGHVQAAAVLRQIRATPESAPTKAAATTGYGVGASGRINTGWVFEGDDLTFSAYLGAGIGRYITDLDTFGGQDAVLDPTTGGLEALPVVAGYVGYELGWTKELRSALTAGWVRVSNLDIQASDSLWKTTRGSVNLIWSPLSRLDFVAEFLGGRFSNKAGGSGTATQLQIGTRYFF